MVEHRMDRRRVIAGGAGLLAGAVAGVPDWTGLPGGRVLAQSVPASPGALEAWRQLAQLTSRAVQLGISVPRLSAHIDTAGGRDFTQIMPATVELLRSLETAQPLRPVAPGEVSGLVDQADDLLRRINQEERNLPDPRPDGPGATTTTVRPSFESVKESYAKLFANCQVREANRSTVEWYMSQLVNGDNQKRWLAVAQEACCPWYFVGIIHAMEASFNFRSHLHNGDSLKARTVLIPSGRPKVWNPPNDWETSAVDALAYDGFTNVTDWTLERTLYRWEAYNGFRSRKNGINTPYLWSFSNHYSKGKFVADNVWDPNAVSKQCGAAVMLKVLVDRKLVRVPIA
ncbi:MAG: hypothetical protein NW205_13505 [Hyphomicrobiaceae bacterium]|nr:hypothetical protein [Hyphomicrobiaceae bacterium]